MNYAKCATCHGLNSMGFCQYTACRYPSTESGVVNASAYVPKIVTNADRLRSMTDEELKAWFCQGHPHTCSGCPFDGIECSMLDWLKQEADHV